MQKETKYIKHIRGDDYTEIPHSLFVKGNWLNKPLHLQVKTEKDNQYLAPLINKKNGLAGGSDNQLFASNYNASEDLTEVKMFISTTETEAFETGKFFGEILLDNKHTRKFIFEVEADLLSENLQELPEQKTTFEKVNIKGLDNHYYKIVNEETIFLTETELKNQLGFVELNSKIKLLEQLIVSLSIDYVPIYSYNVWS